MISLREVGRSSGDELLSRCAVGPKQPAPWVVSVGGLRGHSDFHGRHGTVTGCLSYVEITSCAVLVEIGA